MSGYRCHRPAEVVNDGFFWDHSICDCSDGSLRVGSLLLDGMLLVLDWRKHQWERRGRARDAFWSASIMASSGAWKTGDVMLCAAFVFVNVVSVRLCLPAINIFSPKQYHEQYYTIPSPPKRLTQTKQLRCPHTTTPSIIFNLLILRRVRRPHKHPDPIRLPR